ncbi:MAG: TVP38/TMEM64 family protein [Gemmatimonadaceae bacterium]|nr:TVP38/TMEM64 family protein [Gemmatimonadaceae bacterium]
MKRWLAAGAALAATIAVLVLVGRFAAEPLRNFAEWVDGLGPFAPVVFIAGYIIATVAFVPGLILTLAAGAIFGLLHGTIYVFIGATLGSTAAFLVARYLARPIVEKRLAGNERFQRIDRAIEAEGGRMIVLMRLSPLFPFNALNYALGISKVGFLPYVLGSVGMIPGTLLYVYYGKLAGDLATLGSEGMRRGPEYYLVLLLGLAATAAVVVVGARASRRALGGASAG